MSRKILAGAISAALLTFAAAPAVAETGKSISIDTAGLDLTTEAGMDRIMVKVRRAADRVCDVRSGPRSLEVLNAERKCVDEAVESAVAALTAQRTHQAKLKAAQQG
jgi:UrcA family protein